MVYDGGKDCGTSGAEIDRIPDNSCFSVYLQRRFSAPLRLVRLWWAPSSLSGCCWCSGYMLLVLAYMSMNMLRVAAAAWISHPKIGIIAAVDLCYATRLPRPLFSPLCSSSAPSLFLIGLILFPMFPLPSLSTCSSSSSF